MNLTKKITIAFLLFILHSQVNAQFGRPLDGTLGTRIFDGYFTKYSGERDGQNESYDDNPQVKPKRNFIKLNLPSLAFSNYSLQFERIITERGSLALGLRFMPKGTIPVSSSLKDAFNNADTAIKNTFNNTTLGSYAITPEFRFYVGRRVGKGFYVAPMLRYENWDLAIPINTKLNSGKIISGSLAGTRSSFGGGMQLGTQFHLTNRLVLDWWMGGGLVTSTKYNLSYAQSNLNLSTSEMGQLEDIFTVSNALLDLTATIEPNKISISKSGTNFSVRSGLAIGYKF